MARRRTAGEGSVYQRQSDGRFVATLKVNGRTRSFYAKTQQEAKAKRDRARRTLDQGRILTSSTTRLDTFLDHWLDHAAPSHARPTTVRAYRTKLTRARAELGKLQLSQLHPHHIAELYSHMTTAGYQPTTIRSTHVALSAALAHAVRTELIPRNPASLASPPRISAHPITTLTQDQAQTLLRTTQGTREHALWTVLLTTGIRAGEACALHWSDYRAGRLTIRGSTYTDPGNGAQIHDPKTPGSRRTIHLSALAKAALATHKPIQNRERLAAAGWNDQDLIFPNHAGRPQHSTNIGPTLKRALRAANLPDIRVHDLRHTAATLLLESGIHPKIVQELLGHRSITTTMNVYSHVTPTMHQQAADAMDRIL